MNELAAFGESLRHDLEDWLHAQCASWLPDTDLHIGSLGAVQAIVSDAAALLSACYQFAALDAWLTAGFMPAARAEFDERVAEMARADSGAVPATLTVSTAPRGRDPEVGAELQTSSEIERIPAGGASPASRASGLPPPTAVASSARPRPAASGFQRLKGLQELVARAPSVDDGGLPLEAAPRPETARHRAAPGPSVPAVPSAAHPGWHRTARDEPGTVEPRTVEPRTVEPRTVEPFDLDDLDDRLDERGDGGATASVEALRARFQPLMECATSLAENPGPGRSRPSLAPAEPPAIESRRGPVPAMPASGAEFARPALAAGPATPPARTGRRASVSETSLAAAPFAAELLPSDIESILEAITEDLERDFARQYGGG